MEKILWENKGFLWWSVYSSLPILQIRSERGVKTFGLNLLEKPAVKQLPEKSILSVGEFVLLTCEVTGDPEPFVTWTKDGNTSIPRAQFKNDGRILVIKDILPLDSGVYECKASNKFGESRTSTKVIVAGKAHFLEKK